MTNEISVGQVLRETREAKRLSASEVAEATHMKVQVVEALEADAYSRNAAPIYAKGFIKLYGEFLGLDTEPLIRLYLEAHAAMKRPSLRPEQPVPERRPRSAEPETLWEAAAAPPAERTPAKVPGANARMAWARQTESLRTAAGRLASRLRRRRTGWDRWRGRSRAWDHSMVWQVVAIGIGAVAVLVLLVSGITRFAHRAAPVPHRASSRQAAPALRLAEEPPAPYLKATAP